MHFCQRKKTCIKISALILYLKLLMMISRGAEEEIGLWPHHAGFHCPNTVISCLKHRASNCKILKTSAPHFSGYTSHYTLTSCSSQSRGHGCFLVVFGLAIFFGPSMFLGWTIRSSLLLGRAMEASMVRSKSNFLLRSPTNHHHNAWALWCRLTRKAMSFGSNNLYFSLNNLFQWDICAYKSLIALCSMSRGQIT